MTVSMNTENKANIIVFGIDQFGYRVADKPLELKNSILHFRHFKTEDKFQTYDGVILFQNTFEKTTESEVYSFEEEELLKRENQLRQLIEKKGFCCFLLWTRFVDFQRKGRGCWKHTDLAKRALDYPGLTRTPRRRPEANLRIVRDEFRDFLEEYGSAQTEFTDRNKGLNIKPICLMNDGSLSGFVLNNSTFFVPCLQPGKREGEFEEFFSLLADGLVASLKKLAQELPEWTEEYQKYIEKLQQETGILVNPTIGYAHFDEYPKLEKNNYAKL